MRRQDVGERHASIQADEDDDGEWRDAGHGQYGDRHDERLVCMSQTGRKPRQRLNSNQADDRESNRLPVVSANSRRSAGD